jgi:hypothetical protein
LAVPGFADADVSLKIYVSRPGTLYNLINDSVKYTATELKISGNINGTDIRIIRDMAGRSVYGNETYGMLKKIDMSEVTIVEGGDNYYKNNNVNCYTQRNIFPDYIFSRCTNLESVILPNNITMIGSHALFYCKSLKSIEIPPSVKGIYINAFEYCEDLSSITFNEGLEKIYDWAFSDCPSLTNINFPGSLIEIKAGAFYGCLGLTSIKLSKNLYTIDNTAFEGCTELFEYQVDGQNNFYSTSNGVLFDKYATTLISFPYKRGYDYSIPNSVITIKSGAFRKCKNLTSVTFSKNLSQIGAYSFEGCTGLKSIIIPKSVSKIDFLTFGGCTGLTNLLIEEGVTNIEASAFNGCTGIGSVKLPNSLTNLGGGAFFGCSKLKSVYIGAETRNIGKYVFHSCPSLSEIHVKRNEPAVVDSNSFSGINKNYCTLYIPSGSGYTYHTTKYWSDFINIIEENYVANDKLTDEQLNIITDNGAVIIYSTTNNIPLSIYDIKGTLIKSIMINQYETRVELPESRIYLISSGKYIYKISL